MSDQDRLQRFEELEAGRILGDLDAEEKLEWEELSKDPDCQLDSSLEQVAAAIDAEYSTTHESEISDDLLSQLHKDMAQFVSSEATLQPGPEELVAFPVWKRVLTIPHTPWAIAAVLAVLLVANVLTTDRQPGSEPVMTKVTAPPSAEAARDSIIAREGVVQMKFGGTENYSAMSGDVVWSDELQEGYMTLTNLPVNNPGKKQYQLWIVDPTRDDKPVDGGVFDIPEGAETAIIKINNPLAVSDPKAFVITLEQPGGVVVSKQEEVVAIAKPS